MREPYLEVTFRHGRPLAAYLYLPREPGEKSVRTAKAEQGVLIDFGSHGTPIGIELTAPTRTTPQALNRVLTDLGLPELSAADLEPLRAARVPCTRSRGAPDAERRAGRRALDRTAPSA